MYKKNFCDVKFTIRFFQFIFKNYIYTCGIIYDGEMFLIFLILNIFSQFSQGAKLNNENLDIWYSVYIRQL